MDVPENLNQNPNPLNALTQTLLTEPYVKRLAHLPFLTLFYLYFQRQVVATPVTALELAAYLEVEVKVAEGILAYLEGKGIVRQFKADLPAYTITRDLAEISVMELVALLHHCKQLGADAGAPPSDQEAQESSDKYRRLYSELASEILQLFGQQSVNQIPI